MLKFSFIRNLEETFTYDGQNRLTEVWLGPHAMDAATTAEGVFPATPQAVTYTGFDKASVVKQGNDSISYAYGYDHQRISMKEELGGNIRIKDNLGSWTTITDGNGTVEQRLSYDLWGRRRNTTDFGYGNVSHTFDRGYTFHEHYDGFDLINMKFTLSERSAKLCLSTAERCELGGANGRLYDPILGRMLSPDVVIQDEQSSQAYNRYSYCFNNPLRFTDPSGYVVMGSRNYYDWNSMVYYDFGNHRSNGTAFNTDLSEGKFSPIYDVNGYFLGTDDKGLQGEAIVMRREDLSIY